VKSILAALFFATLVYGVDATIQDRGVEIVVDGKKITVKRDNNDKCLELDQNAKNAWGGSFAVDNLPKECKSSFVNFMGSISPIKIDGVETYGELETLEFLEKVSKNPNEYILVDSRMESWFATGTIASAINMPFTHFVQQSKFTKELEAHLSKLGVVKKDGKYDFGKAKKALFFCNGIWCGQSPQAIAALIKLGYPKEKILWYRGGMQDWRSVGLSEYRP
jgi:rhodanese-related sulfurtransferase